MKKNCWEFANCECQPGGSKTSERGVCPAATATDHDGVNGGENAGRCCWKIPATLCRGEVQGTFSTKLMDCAACDFFKLVKEEEGSQFAA